MPNPNFCVGDWVKLTSDTYSYTLNGSYGRLMYQPHRRSVINTIPVAFCRITSTQPEDNQTSRGYIFPITITHIQRILPSELTPEHHEYWRRLLLNTRTTEAELFRGCIGHSICPVVNHHHSAETILEVIHRLHYSQKFYLDHQDHLEWWNASKPT